MVNYIKKLSFKGNGKDLFAIYILNMLLSIITLSLYYPWAKVAILKYLWSNSELEESNFEFHGTGKEMFIGYIKAILFFALPYGIFYAGALSGNPVFFFLGFFVFFLAMMILVPIAIHGTLRYRSSRSSWRGIHFGYRGDRKVLLKKYIPGLILTAITFGLYYSWLYADIRKYITSNLRFGSLEAEYHGKGSDLFVIHLKGIILSYITLGIYYFWYRKELAEFHAKNTSIIQDETEYKLSSSFTGGDFFGLLLGNFFIILFTLGFGTPWAIVRIMKFNFENLLFNEEIDFNKIQQTEEDYRDATGDDMLDMLDIDFA